MTLPSAAVCTGMVSERDIEIRWPGVRRTSIIALGFLLAGGCSFHATRVTRRTCSPLRVDPERAPHCATPGSRDSNWVLDLDTDHPPIETISTAGRAYHVAIGKPGMWSMPGSARMDMALFAFEGGPALHTRRGKLPGDSTLLGTSTRRITGGDRLWVLRTLHTRRRPYTRTHVLYAVIDGALAAVRTESPTGKVSVDSVLPVADTCTPEQQVLRLRHGTRLEKLATLMAIDASGPWSEVEPEIRAAVGELATSCDRWLHEQATLMLVRGLYYGQNDD
jgi:hypothetical protein